MLYDTEDEIAERPVLNPFRTTWYGQVLGNCFWLFDAVRYWVTRPFVYVAHRMANALGFLSWWTDTMAGRGRERLQKLWWFVLDFIHVEGMRSQVHQLQEQAARSVGDLTHSVQEHTIHNSRMRNFSHRLENARVALQLRWIGFLEWTEQSPLTRALSAPVRAAAWLSFSISDFFQEWLWTREFRHLLYGIPAIVLLMPLVYCAARMPFYSNQLKAKHYEAAASAAMERDDLVAAELYFRKLNQLGDVRDQTAFRSAVLAEQRGELELAYSQIKDLAKPESSVAYEAHLWVAQHINSGQIEQDNPQAAQLLKDALLAAVAQRDTEPSPRIWLAQLYAAEGKHDDVTELLSRLHLQWLSPGQRLQVAGLLRATGDRLEASRVARSVITHYEGLAQAADTEPLSAQDASMWAAAYEILDDYTKAVEVAAKALDDHPDDDDLRTGAMKLAEHALRVAAARGALGVRDRWLVLDRMLEFAPDRGKVLEYIARLADTPQEAARVAELMEAEYSAGTLPASVCRKLGDLAVIKSDNSLARSWYSRAVEIDPKQDAAVNNLAYLTAHSDPVDLDVALQLANQAVELDPDNSHYRETRGQILILLQQWQAAIDDLAKAVNGMPTKWQIHESLSTAYAETGNPTLAKAHAEQFRRLRASGKAE